MQDDKKIIVLCKRGEREGFNLLFKAYEKYIYKICFCYSHSNEDALDLMQEVFIKLYKSFGSFEESKDLLPWIKRITVNTCLNFARDSKSNTVSIQQEIDDESNTLENVLESSSNVESQVVGFDTKRIIEDEIRKLPQEMKMAMILRHVDGMSYDEIAKTMSSPKGTVRTYLHRGRNILKEALKKLNIWEV